MRPDYSLISSLSGKLIVSCQDFVPVMIEAAIAGGADALRINSPNNVKLARSKTDIPIIACNKMYFPNSPIYITPSVPAALNLIVAGADFVALDCTMRRRVRESPDQIISAVHEKGTLVVADLSSIDEAELSIKAGADILSTTLRPHFDEEFIKELVKLGKPVLAEGHIKTPVQCKTALECGAWAVCVGSAITRPHLITEMFKNAIGAL